MPIFTGILYFGTFQVLPNENWRGDGGIAEESYGFVLGTFAFFTLVALIIAYFNFFRLRST